MKRDGDKGHRRVVASPKPLQVLEARAIKARCGLAGSGVAWQTCKAVVSSGTQLTPVKALKTRPVCHQRSCGPYHASLWSSLCGVARGRQTAWGVVHFTLTNEARLSRLIVTHKGSVLGQFLCVGFLQ